MNLPQDKRGAMRMLPPDKKAQMVALNSQTNADMATAKETVKLLKDDKAEAKNVRRALENCRVALTNNPMSWINEFRDHGGLDEVLTLLTVWGAR